MNNSYKYHFLSEVKEHWKSLLFAILFPLLAIILALKSDNKKLVSGILSEAMTPQTLLILMPIFVFGMLCIIIKNWLKSIKTKDIKIFDDLFFILFNFLLGLSISTSLSKVFLWESKTDFFKDNFNLPIFDVLDYTSFPIAMLVFHGLVDVFTPEEIDPISSLFYWLFKILLAFIYLLCSLLAIFVLCKIIF